MNFLMIYAIIVTILMLLWCGLSLFLMAKLMANETIDNSIEEIANQMDEELIQEDEEYEQYMRDVSYMYDNPN